MIQQLIALVILAFFVFKVFKQWKKGTINTSEFIFWLIFWIIGLLAIIFIKLIDEVVISLGFSSSGINLVFYLAVLLLFYLIFKMRLKILKLEKDITDLSRKIALRD